jgi:lipopolysaccharide assembly protein B
MSYLSHYYIVLKNQAPLSLLLLGALFLLLCLVVIIKRNSTSWKEKNRLKELEKENRIFKKVFNLLFQDNKESVLNELRKLAETSPDTDEIYLETARLLRERGETAKAIRMNKSLLLKPRLDKNLKILIFSELGLNYGLSGDMDKAIGYFKEVLQIDSKNIRAYSHLVKLYEKKKAWDDAFDSLKRLLKIKGLKENRKLISFRIEAGNEKYKRGDLREALHSYKQALSLDGNCFHALVALGDLYDRQGKKTKAFSFWKKAVEGGHHYLPSVLSKIERLLFKLNRSDEMEILYKEFLDKDPGNAGLHLLLGRFFLRKEMPDQARAEFQKAIARDPLIPDSYACLLEINNSEENYHIPLEAFRSEQSSYQCKECGFSSGEIFCKCPSCEKWDSLLLSF